MSTHQQPSRTAPASISRDDLTLYVLTPDDCDDERCIALGRGSCDDVAHTILASGEVERVACTPLSWGGDDENDLIAETHFSGSASLHEMIGEDLLAVAYGAGMTVYPDSQSPEDMLYALRAMVPVAS